jgi:hypothetical protein
VAETFGGWPHQVGEYPLHYYRKLTGYLFKKARLEREAIEKSQQDPDAIEVDAEDLIHQESFTTQEPAGSR